MIGLVRANPGLVAVAATGLLLMALLPVVLDLFALLQITLYRSTACSR